MNDQYFCRNFPNVNLQQETKAWNVRTIGCMKGF